MRKVIILGSGPAGYSAALYTARANLNSLLLTGEQPGGQLMIAGIVENYLGFPQGIMGPELMERMRQQTEYFGAEILDETATAVDFSSKPLKVMVGDRTYQTETVIVATGASAKWLGLDSESRFRGRGVSACATCDAPLFKGKDVIVVGGGDTAVEDALFLAKFARITTLVHRRNQLRASKILQTRIFESKKVRFQWNSVIVEILGKTMVDSVMIRDVKTKKIKQLDCQGVFVAIGHIPNTEIFKKYLERDSKGYIITHSGTKTSVEGVFAAGDVQDPFYRQAITATGSGCMAAIDVERYLQSKGSQ
jgi:thioredoxin reductase (NADPH)